MSKHGKYADIFQIFDQNMFKTPLDSLKLSAKNTIGYD